MVEARIDRFEECCHRIGRYHELSPFYHRTVTGEENNVRTGRAGDSMITNVALTPVVSGSRERSKLYRARSGDSQEPVEDVMARSWLGHQPHLPIVQPHTFIQRIEYRWSTNPVASSNKPFLPLSQCSTTITEEIRSRVSSTIIAVNHRFPHLNRFHRSRVKSKLFLLRAVSQNDLTTIIDRFHDRKIYIISLFVRIIIVHRSWWIDRYCVYLTKLTLFNGLESTSVGENKLKGISVAASLESLDLFRERKRGRREKDGGR